ncbi:hypothetical protein BDQ17DRAFT_1439628 [Cyathus striatus]|nr:hypothetical protein BDQ17DRAFT_1439628 [Cyathus striatus]
MTTLMSALQWPSIILTKLGYLIDNQWSDTLDLAENALLELAKLNCYRVVQGVPVSLPHIHGGLVIGLPAGLLAPVIGASLAGALTTAGITCTGTFLGRTAGAAVITTGGVLTWSGIAMKGISNCTQYIQTFDILSLHNNKRVDWTFPGFMSPPLPQRNP